MVLNTHIYWGFGLCPLSVSLETFRKVDLFPSSSKEGRHLLCWFLLKDLTIPVNEVSSF
jgi:hypothetical protein